ncbi:hypothetical protein BAUCODRAFT_398843 [Baudoinia panamericana UAMH 10762]|uniref:Tat pathway signal sequence n=1 Tax=Baudoinia panamericana (strain UAMH 10762) TaxID=717646 RepID=M2N5K3_BAUPA|nr:uncharacterized protein BAUCODRAFT_398843 [Baudoinia panamericana UAMH 10762]EMC99313.1 hypothetical protein BAUCODRAFT_398843 [Baudoinia panamericana UAMH 10762]
MRNAHAWKILIWHNMAIFKSTPASQESDSALRLPAQKRTSPPASYRLSTITESSNAGNPSTSQPKSILRNSGGARPSPLRQHFEAGSKRPSQDTTRTAPPSYTWVPESVDGYEDLTAPVEGEKLAELRRNGGYESPKRRKLERGGWGRLALIVLIVLAVIGLGVGLGVGLTVGRRHSGDISSSGGSSNQPPGTTPNIDQIQQFPLGEYSMITALRMVQTNCTSNPATWRCYPYSVFSATDSGTNTSSLATFNWIVSNTSMVYPTNSTTRTTSDQGIPSNLTISSTNNPFSISFTNRSLTYFAASNNVTSPRLSFNFTMSKSVIPSAAITSSNVATECFFNNTVFTGTLYLSAQRTFPSGALANSTGIGGYTPWPYALEVTQTSAGEQDVPACYELANGAAGTRLTDVTTPESAQELCLCDYRNY